MTCNEIRQQELLENYILGRLDDEQQKALEAHLKQCDSCRKKLEQERYLISGIRKRAREELKQALHEEVARQKSSPKKQDWTLYFKVAAVLFFVVLAPGILYYHYSFGPYSPKPTSVPETELQKPSLPSPEPTAPVQHEKSTREISLREQKTDLSQNKDGESSIVQTSKQAETEALSQRPKIPIPSEKEQLQREALDKISMDSHRYRLSAYSAQSGVGRSLHFPDGIRMEVGERLIHMTLIGNTGLNADTLPVEILKPQNGVYPVKWFLPDSVLRNSRNNINFKVINDSTIISLFPDSSLYQIKLGQKPTSVRLDGGQSLNLWQKGP